MAALRFLSQTHCLNHAVKYDCAPMRSIGVGSMKTCLAAAGLAVTLSLTSPAVADQLSDGTAAYHGRDYTTAFTLLRPLAEQGNARAENLVGLMYVNGLGVEADIETGIAWLDKAADQGDMNAERMLAALFIGDSRIASPGADAMSWLHKAADRNFPPAETSLGAMYLMGTGVPMNDGVALDWFRKAADQGYPKAQGELGRMYATGQGTPTDNVQALMWITLAAKGGDASVKQYAEIIATKMTPEQIAEAQKLAAVWTPTAPTPRIVTP